MELVYEGFVERVDYLLRPNFRSAGEFIREVVCEVVDEFVHEVANELIRES